MITLDKLTMENFRQFAGRQEIIFSKSTKKPITLIRGANASGKTSLVTALQWPLPGSTMKPLGISRKIGLKHQEEAKVMVTRVFSASGQKYELHSTMQLEKQRGKVMPSCSYDFHIGRVNSDEVDLLTGEYYFTKRAILRVPNLEEFIMILQGDCTSSSQEAILKSCINLEGYRNFLKHVNDRENILSENMTSTWLFLILASIGNPYPWRRALVMDSPFIRLDMPIKQHFAKSLLKIKDQVILLATDAELVNVEKIIADKVGKEYVLEVDNASNTTRIVAMG